ncbi:hypothetical protein [Streptomyces yokosukanensis]|uniref:hypothetical protein n=1 Tax=Streptomyces yokosukanensis TaxID=67386 RepID=UPI00131EC489|nr:hypothetical protein [Streptomyces yokosukanensis]
MTALTLLALTLIRYWIVNTREERRILAAAQREAQAERTRYIAAQAALECEQGRLNRDMTMARQSMAGDLLAEREAMRDHFEEKRAELISETMEATFRMFRDGKFAPDTSPVTGQLIRFPRQEQAAVQHGRSREHGIVGP